LVFGYTRRETARYEILNVLHRLKQLFNHLHAIKQFCLAFFPQITGEIVSVSWLSNVNAWAFYREVQSFIPPDDVKTLKYWRYCQIQMHFFYSSYQVSCGI
jgi:hypothetical protein